MLCVTAQHREMLDSALRLFELKPDYDLDVMTPRQDLTDVTAAVLDGMRGVPAEAKPDRVLVQGDTTTLLAAFYARIPVGHVEAGLRTGDISAPWPEEMNRRLADALSDRQYAPTETACRRLLDEGLPDATDFQRRAVMAGCRIYSTERFNHLRVWDHQVSECSWKISDAEFRTKCRDYTPGLDLNRAMI